MLAKGFKRIPDLKGKGINNWLLLVQSVLAQDNPDSIPENLTPAVSSGHVPETEMSARLPSWTRLKTRSSGLSSNQVRDPYHRLKVPRNGLGVYYK